MDNAKRFGARRLAGNRAGTASEWNGSANKPGPSENGVYPHLSPAAVQDLAELRCVAGAFGRHDHRLRPAGTSIDWYKVAGGGGMNSTGGVYSVSGTVGQPDASGAMSGGGYSLTGGFWALYTVQTAGAPVLQITLTATNTAMVYWPSPSTGFNLEVNTNLATANWVTNTQSITDNGTIRYIVVNPPTGNRYYRLKSP